MESKEQTFAEALLELGTLVNPILYTQEETGGDAPDNGRSAGIGGSSPRLAK